MGLSKSKDTTVNVSVCLITIKVGKLFLVENAISYLMASSWPLMQSSSLLSCCQDAKSFIMSLMPIYCSSDSMTSIGRLLSLPWLTVERKLFFIIFSLLNDLSPPATVTGIVLNSPSAMQMSS